MDIQAACEGVLRIDKVKESMGAVDDFKALCVTMISGSWQVREIFGDTTEGL
jgi:hypothetical protein